VETAALDTFVPTKPVGSLWVTRVRVCVCVKEEGEKDDSGSMHVKPYLIRTTDD
jgi:hypothetical protein